MKFVETNPPERGAMTIVYRCPTCSHEIAMVTNPFETELVGSLAGEPVSVDAASHGNTPKCPVTDSVAKAKAAKVSGDEVSRSVGWTPEALERLQNIPEFVRPVAKQGIERMALERHYSEINEDVLDEAKDFFGM